MSAPDEPDPATRRRELEDRNAALRDRIDGMLSDLRRRTADLREKQAEAARRTHEVTSEDGLVTARVDATGTLQDLTLTEKAFERSTPARLAEVITSVVREASGGARQSLRADFASLIETPDLSDIAADLPDVSDHVPTGPLVEPPDPAAERARRAGSDSPAARSSGPDPDDDVDDEPPDSFLTGGRW